MGKGGVRAVWKRKEEAAIPAASEGRGIHSRIERRGKDEGGKELPHASGGKA